jgi:hypothetical protein
MTAQGGVNLGNAAEVIEEHVEGRRLKAEAN